MPRRLRRLPCLVLGGGVRIVVACGWRARLLGLAGLREWDEAGEAVQAGEAGGGLALLLAPCRSVHTFGMRRSLDLVWLGAGGAVARVDSCVRPWRVRSCRGAVAVLETAPGRGASVADELRRRH